MFAHAHTARSAEELTIPTSCVSIIGVPLLETDPATWSRYLEQQGITVQPVDSVQSATNPQVTLNVNVVNAENLPENQTEQGTSETFNPRESVTVSVNVADTNTLTLNLTGIDDVQNVQTLHCVPRSVIEQLQTAGIITLGHHDIQPVVPVSEVNIANVMCKEETESKGDYSDRNDVESHSQFKVAENEKNPITEIASVNSEKNIVSQISDLDSDRNTPSQSTDLNSEKNSVPQVEETATGTIIFSLDNGLRNRGTVVGKPLETAHVQKQSNIETAAGTIDIFSHDCGIVTKPHETANVQKQSSMETATGTVRMFPFGGDEHGQDSLIVGQLHETTDIQKESSIENGTGNINIFSLDNNEQDRDVTVDQPHETADIQEQSSIKSSKIFSKIVAFLSEEILSAVLGDQSTIAEELEKQDDVAWNRSLGQCSISGDLNALMKMQKKIKTLLNPEQPYQDIEKVVSKVDRAVQTDTNMKANSSTMCDILVPALSTYGREIKQPARFNPYSDLSLTAIEEDIEPKSKIYKRRRKLHRSMHVFQQNGVIQDSNSEQIESQNVNVTERLMENIVSQDETLLTPNDLDLMPQNQENTLIQDNSHEEEDIREKVDDNPAGVDIENSQELEEDNNEDDNFENSFLKPRTKKDYESLAPFKFFCSLCSFKTKRQSHYVKHSKLHETTSKMYFCKQCDFKTIRCSTLRRHELSHSKVLLQCSECNYKTDAATHLARHIKLKHRMMKSFKRELKSLFQCKECNYKTVMAARYRKHLESHGSLFDKIRNDPEIRKVTFQCDKCMYKTSQKGHYVRHQKNVHSNHRPYLCDLCGSAFKRPDALTQHKIVHVDKNYRQYSFSCTMCGKGFRSKAHLTEHMAMHSSARQYLCDICGAAFKTKSCQQKHLKSIHHNPRSYTCDQCSKRFNTKYALKRHLRTHEKPGGLITVQEVTQEDLNQIESQIASQAFQSLQSDQLPSHDQLQSHDQQQELVQDIITSSSIYDQAIENLRQATSVNENDTAILYLSNTGF